MNLSSQHACDQPTGKTESPTPSSHRRLGTLLGGGLILAFVLLGWATLSDYGLTWDEGLGDMFFGDRYWAFFKSGGDKRYLDFEHRALDFHTQPGQADFFNCPWRTAPQHYWPVASTTCAAFGELLNRRLPLLDPIDARHAGIVVLAALALLAVWTFSREFFGTTAASFAVLLLATHPNFWGHAHNNLKDVGQCAFYSWTIVSLYRGVMRWSLGWIVATGAFWGLAMGTKLNALFIPVTMVPWLVLVFLVHWRTRRVWTNIRRTDILRLVLIPPLLGVAVYILAWPWLWPNVVGRLRQHYGLFYSRATEATGHWQLYPIWETIIATPLPMLALLAVGLACLVACRSLRQRWAASLLLVLWLAVPIARCTPPSILNFDGIRHFMEFLPAAAIIGGCGAQMLCEIARRRRIGPSWLAVTIVLALALIPPVWSNTRAHPFQTAYVNILGRGHFTDDYWCNSYRVACRWLNASAEPGATISTPIASHLLRLAGPIWLRPDLQVEESVMESPPPGSPPRYVLLLNRPAWLGDWKSRLDQHGRIQRCFEYRGNALLWIYKVEPLPPRDGHERHPAGRTSIRWPDEQNACLLLADGVAERGVESRK